MEKFLLCLTCGLGGFILGWLFGEWRVLRKYERVEMKKRDREEQQAWALYEAQKIAHRDGPPPRSSQPRVRLNG